MEQFGILLGILGILATVVVWLFPDARHAVLSWIGFHGTRTQHRESQIASEPKDLLRTENETTRTQPSRNAYDFINLGEHLWYLGNSIDQEPHSIGESISAFTQRLDKCGFAATRAAARSIEATTVGQLQSQMVAINSSLYTETAPREAAFIKLGEFLWYVSHPKTATTQALENGIKGFLEQLEKCNLESRKAAAPLERFRYVYFQLDNMVAGASLDELAAIMQPIRLRIQHETQDVKLED